jgi:drug/metabolite transporter (DMT)-like permease
MRERLESALPAYLALAAAIAGISWSAILVRWAGVPGPVSGFYRVLIAALVLIPWRLARPVFRRRDPQSYPPVSRRAMAIAVGGGVFFALDLALWNTAVLKTQAALASLLGNNTPIFVGILSWVWWRRRPRVSFWIGLGLSLIGCLLIMSASLTASAGASGRLSGNLLALTASFFFAAYLMTTEHVRASMDTLTFNSLAIVGSAVSLLVMCLLLRLPLGGYPPRTWAALVGLGLVSQLGAYYALVYALGHLPATVTSVGLLAQVPCTAVLAMLLLREPLSLVQLAGGVVVLAGIYVVNALDARPSRNGAAIAPRADGAAVTLP